MLPYKLMIKHGLVLLYMMFHVPTPLLCRSRELRGWWNHCQYDLRVSASPFRVAP
jgi:hypothetical protein